MRANTVRPYEEKREIYKIGTNKNSPPPSHQILICWCVTIEALAPQPPSEREGDRLRWKEPAQLHFIARNIQSAYFSFRRLPPPRLRSAPPSRREAQSEFLFRNNSIKFQFANFSLNLPINPNLKTSPNIRTPSRLKINGCTQRNANR